MTIHITYFVHGTTIDNEKEVSSGWKDVELSPLGTEQSQTLWDKIDMKKFDVVFCSDLIRALHSAQITFWTDVPIIQDARLRECNYWIYNGESSIIVEPLQEKCIFERFPEGESYEDVRIRILDFLNDIKKNYDGQHIAIVAHKAPQLALDVILNRKNWQQAFAEDWRKTKSWRAGWDYRLD